MLKLAFRSTARATLYSKRMAAFKRRLIICAKELSATAEFLESKGETALAHLLRKAYGRIVADLYLGRT